MITAKQLAADLQALHSGDCWIGYNATEILEGITREMALIKACESGNSIWQIVNHISFWRGVVAKRLSEKRVVVQDQNGMEPPSSVNAVAWEQTLKRFNASFELLYAAIAGFDDKDLFNTPGDNGTYYYNITGCLQHDAFHLGQIMLLKKLALSK